MSVRAATPEDLEDVLVLEAELGGDAWPPGLLEEGLAGEVPTVSYLAVEVDGALAGYAAVSVAGDIAELQRIAVAPARRRTGLASDLLEAVLTRARAERADRLLLEVREDNLGALAFYAATGFVEIDRRRRYYRDGTTAVVMRRALGRGACG